MHPRLLQQCKIKRIGILESIWNELFLNSVPIKSGETKTCHQTREFATVLACVLVPATLMSCNMTHYGFVTDCVVHEQHKHPDSWLLCLISWGRTGLRVSLFSGGLLLQLVWYFAINVHTVVQRMRTIARVHTHAHSLFQRININCIFNDL